MSNTTPAADRADKCGVNDVVLPYMGKAGADIWSAMINRIFGCIAYVIVTYPKPTLCACPAC